MIRLPIRLPILYLILLTVTARSLTAGEALIVTLQNVGERVRSHNLELRAARHIIDENLGLQKHAGRLKNPEIDITINSDDRYAERSLEVGILQKLPVTGRLRLEKEHSATQVEAARKEVAVVENQLVAEARAALIEVLALRSRKSLLMEQAEVLGKLAEFTAKAAEGGEASLLDVGQAKLEKARIDAECLSLEAEMKCALVELKPLLGMKPDDSLVLSGQLPDIKDPVAARQPESPSVALARLDVRSAEQLAEIERTRRYDDIKVGVYATMERSIDAPEPIEHEGMLSLRLMAPLPIWNNNQGKIDAANARASRCKGELEALEQRIVLETATLREEMARWAVLAAEVENQLLPQATQQTELIEKAWRDGQVSLLEVMKSREQCIELAVARLDALKSYHLAHVRYLKSLGSN